jgi:hypothetical protein
MRLLKFSCLTLVIALLLATGAPASKEKTTRLMVANPFRISLTLEVKCDWLPKEGRYYFYKKIFIPKRTNVVLTVPKVTFCEIWPLDFKIF